GCGLRDRRYLNTVFLTTHHISRRVAAQSDTHTPESLDREEEAMPRSKGVNEQEVIRWAEEGKTDNWMAEEYERKYNIQTTPSMFGNFRLRRGLDRRIGRDDNLIPWEVKKEHRWHYPLAMLRVEARRREGRPLRESDAQRLASWKQMLAEQDLVVHYDP